MTQEKKHIGVGCGALILNEKNQVLLLKRSKECRNQIGFWSIPGGGIHFFETIEEALKRECKEEIGVDIEIVKLLSLTNEILKEENQHWIAPQFLCKIKNNQEPKNVEPHKHEELAWFDMNNLPEKLTLPTKNSTAAIKDIKN